MQDGSVGLGHQELDAFVAKLRAFRATLDPNQQRLLDEVLLAAAETGEVQGYAFDGQVGRHAALAAVAALGLAWGTLASPLASSAEASAQAQSVVQNTSGPASNAPSSPAASTTLANTALPATAARIGGLGAIGATSLVTAAGPIVVSAPAVSQADVQEAIRLNRGDIGEAENFKRLAEEEVARLSREREASQPPGEREQALRTEVQFWDSHLTQLRAFGDRLQQLLP